MTPGVERAARPARPPATTHPALLQFSPTGTIEVVQTGEHADAARFRPGRGTIRVATSMDVTAVSAVMLRRLLDGTAPAGPRSGRGNPNESLAPSVRD